MVNKMTLGRVGTVRVPVLLLRLSVSFHLTNAFCSSSPYCCSWHKDKWAKHGNLQTEERSFNMWELWMENASQYESEGVLCEGQAEVEDTVEH